MKILRAMLVLLLLAGAFTSQSLAQVPGHNENLLPPSQEGQKKIGIPDSNQDDDEIIVIPGPKIGRQEKPVLTPALLEMLYRAVWMKVGKEYQDPYKLADWASWEHKFKGKLQSEADLDSAIKELLSSLNDRWTIYHAPSEIAGRKQAVKDGYLSIGMHLRKHADDAWHIDGMQFGTPAMQSVLREGDIVKSINGKPLSGLSQADVAKLLMGKEGEKVSVLAFYDGSEHAVELVFAQNQPDQVAVGLLPGNILYIRLPTFVSQEVVANFVQVLGQAYERTGGQISGIVFDLRYNGGGLVTMALTVSSLFTEDGTITRTTTRSDRTVTDTHYKVIPIPQYLEARMPKQAAEFQHFLQTVPLVILTNGSTASASEITTGALKDNGRAFVIGVKTFGKAVGYTVTPLPNGGAVQVTNLSYLTPNGSNIADKGIDPDLLVEQPRGQAILSESDEQVKAAHEHLLKIAKERARQLGEAQDLSVKPQVDPERFIEKPGRGFVMHPLYLLLAGTFGTLVLSVLAFAVSRKLKK